ncbi:type 1 fimbria pilin [Ewingella americana]
MNNLKKILLVGLIASPLLLVSQSTQAACSWGEPGKELTQSMTFGNVIVQRDTPVGSVVASVNLPEYAGGEVLFRCDTAWVYNAKNVLFTTLSSYGNTVYDTNISGLGIRITLTTRAVPSTGDFLKDQGVFIKGGTIELIKTSTGSVGAGNLTTGDAAYFFASQDPTYRAVLRLTGSNTITPVACSVSNTVINVSLDDAVYSDFSGVGSTAKPKDFNIGLNCDAGTNVKLTLDGNAAGPAGVLALNAGSNQAKGIGIQLVKSAAPVALGTPLDFGTATSAGDMQLPLIARYYQTEASITGGTTNTTATFTMTYN